MMKEKSPSKTDSLIYTFLGETYKEVKLSDSFESFETNDILKKKSSVEDFLFWLDGNLEKLETKEKNMIGDKNETENTEISDSYNKNPNLGTSYLPNLLKSETLSNFSKGLYSKYEKTTKNVKPLLQTIYTTVKRELNDLKTSSNVQFNSERYANKLKYASNAIVGSYSSIKNACKSKNKKN